jgi:hypothetical protein
MFSDTWATLKAMEIKVDQQNITNVDPEEPKDLCNVYNITPKQWHDFYEQKNSGEFKVLNNFLSNFYLLLTIFCSYNNNTL